MAAPAPSKDKNSDDEEQESQMSPELKHYHMMGIEIRKEVDRLLTTTDQFKVSSETYFEFEIQLKSFRIRQVVSYSSDTKNKNDPLIWYVDTVCPGSPQMVYECFMPKYREEWDLSISSFRKIHSDEAFPNISIFHKCLKGGGGGLISPRDFVDLLVTHEFTNKETGYRSVQTAQKSVESLFRPEQKGFVRGNVMMGSLLCERLSDEKMEEMGLPRLLVAVNGDSHSKVENKEKTKICEWTRVRYVIQMDLKGWIPASVP